MSMLRKLLTHGRQGTLVTAIGWTLFKKVRPLFRVFLLDHRIIFRVRVGYWPHLGNPRSFYEKVYWLKLHNRDHRIAALEDKLLAREYVSERCPDVRLPRVLFVADSPDSIPFSELRERCVIKSSFGSYARHLVFFDPASSNHEATRDVCRSWLTPRPSVGGTWAYQIVQQSKTRQLFGEELLIDERGRIPRDYKILVFHGEAKYLYVVDKRFCSQPTLTFFDACWNHLGATRVGYELESSIPRPKRFSDMLRIAELLACGFPLVRVDLYEVRGEIYFGEFTFWPSGGLGRFLPPEFDFVLGEELELPCIQGQLRIVTDECRND